MNPKVTFIIPCYNLGHFLAECVNSILSQTYQDFEVLIMDDCSPDQTPEVARSFKDEHVIYVRNETNLGHLKNYNKGIDLAKGEYVWLISADDRLRCTAVLERFVAVLDTHPTVGYVFCPAVNIVDGSEKGISKWVFQEPSDAIFPGHTFLDYLIEYNRLQSPSGLVRRRCYGDSKFPLDLPYSGDWYLWCLFALHHDVAYVAEPMVNYRLHDGSMTTQYSGPKIEQRIANEIAVRWRIMRDAERSGYSKVLKKCEEEIVNNYSHRVIGKQENNWVQGLTLDAFDISLAINAMRPEEVNKIRARVYFAIGDSNYWRGNWSQALRFYRLALRDRFSAKPWLKSLLLGWGIPGERVLETLSSTQQIIRSLLSNFPGFRGSKAP